MSKNGLIILTPTSIAYTGTSATISANGSVSFTACSALRLDGVFSADYDNYIVVSRHSATADVSMRLRFSVGGTEDATASSYVYQYLLADSTTLDAARGATTYGYLGSRGNTQRAGSITTIYGPYLTQPTAYRSVYADDYNSASVTDFVGTHNQSTSYDGFGWHTGNASYTFTGRVAVYGMRK